MFLFKHVFRDSNSYFRAIASQLVRFGNNQENWRQVKQTVLDQLDMALHDQDHSLHSDSLNLIASNLKFLNLMRMQKEFPPHWSPIIAKALNVDIRIIQPKPIGFVISDGTYSLFSGVHEPHSLSKNALYLYYDGFNHYDGAILQVYKSDVDHFLTETHQSILYATENTVTDYQPIVIRNKINKNIIEKIYTALVGLG